VPYYSITALGGKSPLAPNGGINSGFWENRFGLIGVNG